MAGNTKNLVRDAGNLPAPQYYNPTTDAYEYVHGANGGLNVNNYIQTAGGLWVPQKANNNGEALVQLTGSIVPDAQAIPVKGIARVEVETLVNAQSVAASGGQTTPVSIGGKGEDETYVLINCDKTPWSFRSGATWNVAHGYGSPDCVYPKRDNVATAYSHSANPCISLFLGFSFAGYVGMSEPTSLQEAKSIAIPASNEQIKVLNYSEEIATVTIRVVRVWRG